MSITMNGSAGPDLQPYTSAVYTSAASLPR